MNELLTLLLILFGSALAVGLVVALNAVLGGWTPSALDSPEAAAQALERDVLGFRAGQQAVACTGQRAALVMEANGARLGLALASGASLVCRALWPGEVRGAQAQGRELVISLDDFTLPRARLTLASAQQAQDWAGRITAFAEAAPAGKTAKDATT
ncbi:hypothetical protein F1654_06765 [Alkalicaulis satelles]|uniref:Uncharacterized protein n=1 Tax=Alkalicaulis satelles TaxID=2609175 RepID=A0A5M6ZMJ0_9PROT|nr:hypothetical protein [Alkalicaulis satelles]KAA5803501.1 hypothetical protein F1654_06765 [Alkalicaulis satelles]